MVVRLKEEHVEEYKKLHAAGNAGVRDLLVKYHLRWVPRVCSAWLHAMCTGSRCGERRNFTIFLQRMPDGHLYEFGTYVYTGTNLKHDMGLLAKEPRNIAWLAVCDPMQARRRACRGGPAREEWARRSLPFLWLHQECITPGDSGWTMSELVFYNE